AFRPSLSLIILMSFLPSGSLNMSEDNSTQFVVPDLEAAGDHGDASVMPKFDKHIITSVLEEAHVEWIAKIYGIPLDLHPRPAVTGMTMEELSDDVVDHTPAFSSYDEGEVERLREVIITLHKLTPSLLYVIGLNTVWKHTDHECLLKDLDRNVVTMAKFLRLSNFSGAKDALKAAQKAAQHAGASVQTKKTVEKRSAGKRGFSKPKKKKTCKEPSSHMDLSFDHVSYPITINQAHPLKILTNAPYESDNASNTSLDIFSGHSDEHESPLDLFPGVRL
nr:hypothetical protein [Tanacetum cinerariifolium]